MSIKYWLTLKLCDIINYFSDSIDYDSRLTWGLETGVYYHYKRKNKTLMSIFFQKNSAGQNQLIKVKLGWLNWKVEPISGDRHDFN